MPPSPEIPMTAITSILASSTGYTLDAALLGGARMGRAARRATTLMARRQRIECGWTRFTACLARTGQENVMTVRAAPRAGTPANREAATHVVWQPGGMQTCGGLTPDGGLWYIPR